MKNKILYLTYTGMTEALGASQVLSYLNILSVKYDIFLVSLEHNGDFHDKEKMNSVAVQMNKSNIHWYPYEYKGGVKGYLSNFITMYKCSKGIIQKENISLLHCRSYRSTMVAFYLKKYKIEYIFDTRGFWFDEKADVGSINRNGLLFRILKIFEKKLYLKAYHITILSYLGKETLVNGKLFNTKINEDNITVIPTCVDLDRFKKKHIYMHSPITIGYVGNVEGWYDFDKTVDFLYYLKKQIKCNVLFFNQGQNKYIVDKMSKKGFVLDIDFSIENVEYKNMPSKLQEIDVSIFFIKPLFSKRASAATKIGELLACGIPIITNNNVGDHEYIINKYNAGKIIDMDKIESYDLKKVIQDLCTEKISANCRFASEDYFSLFDGCVKYSTIYDSYFDK